MSYSRHVETIFDLLASLGGFFSALTILFYSFVRLLHFYGSYQFVMNNLFVDSSTKLQSKLNLPINRRQTTENFKK